MAHRVVGRIRSGVCRRNRFVLSSELKPGVNMLAKRYPQGRWAWVARIAPKRLGLALILMILGLGFAGNGCHSQKNSASLSIEFTRIPPAVQGGKERVDTISGRVRNAGPKQQIVIYAHSGQWWVQPEPDRPFIPIKADSTWSTETHLGFEDRRERRAPRADQKEIGQVVVCRNIPKSQSRVRHGSLVRT